MRAAEGSGAGAVAVAVVGPPPARDVGVVGDQRALIAPRADTLAVEGELHPDVPTDQGVLAAPGHRDVGTADHSQTVGRLCAGFDRVILKEDDERRGRAPGEIARLLREGLREAGMADEEIAIVQPRMVVIMGPEALETICELALPLAQPIEPRDAARAAS